MDWIGSKVRGSCQRSVEDSREALQTMRRVCAMECVDSVGDHPHAPSLRIVESIEMTCPSQMEPARFGVLCPSSS